MPSLVACGDDGGGAADTSTGGTTQVVGTSMGETAPSSDGTTNTQMPTTDDAGTTVELDSSGSDSSSGGWTPSVDCDMLPALPAADMTYMSEITSSEDFTFDAEGNLIGVSFETQGLHRTAYDGTTVMIVPNVSSWGRGVRVLDNGDYLVIAPGEGLHRITPEGSDTVVLNLSDEANGLALHPNGIAYFTSGNGQLRSFDPDTGEVAVLDQGDSFDGIAFNVDYTKLYYNSETGLIRQLAFTEGGEPTGEPSDFATIPVQEILDGMTVDECDNLYVVEMLGTIWRVSADGTMEVAVSLPPKALYSALNFGSGIGGWEADHLYIMSLIGGVYEVDMGVQGKPLPHLP